MILHLLSDEKFVDYVINVFEETSPGGNHYLIPSESCKLQYVKSTNKDLIVSRRNSEEFREIIKNLHIYNGIIAHNLYDEYKKEIIRSLPLNMHVHWMCWGTDLYFIPQLSSRILGYETRKAISKYNLNSVFYSFEEVIKNYFPSIWDRIALFRGNSKGYWEYKDLLKCIDSYSTVLPNEVKFVKKYLTNKPYIPFKYAMVENCLSDMGNVCDKDDFLIGNSATITNNHLDVFAQLKDVDTGKLFVPLSYGDGNYSRRISKSGESLFGNRFVPLYEFLDKEEFSKLLSHCGNVIMNQHRQQGLGTILMSLWKGARVFINPVNPVYIFFKQSGLMIFSTKELKCWKSLPAHNELASVNRPILKKLYGKKIVLNEVSQLINYISKSQTIVNR